MKWYYILIADTIYKMKSDSWKKDSFLFYTILFISFAIGFNFFMLSFILHDFNILKIESIQVSLNTTGFYFIDSFLSYAVVYLFPFLILNYFLIFHKDKYKEIIIKYKHYNGKLFSWYFVISLMAFPLFFIVGAIKYYFFG
jgi:hypothetical protein